MKGRIKITGIQIDIRDALSCSDRKNNVSHAINLIRSAGETDLVVLPELFTVGYSKDTFEKLDELAETSGGKTFEMLAETAVEKNCHICFGFPQKTGDRFFISQAVIDNRGNLLDIYSKIHLAQFGDSMEKHFFTRGNRTVVFEIKGVKIGIIVCYDFRFPELSRKLALEGGIDLLLHPVAYSRDRTFPSWHHFVIARAMENQVYMLSINRAGKNYGNSIFCPPWVDEESAPVILGSDEGILEGEINMEIISRIRTIFNYRGDIRQDY